LGWVIADIVNFQAKFQYIVIPKQNLAYRRVVKKEHILDWVSAEEYRKFKRRHRHTGGREAAMESEQVYQVEGGAWDGREIKRDSRLKASNNDLSVHSDAAGAVQHCPDEASDTIAASAGLKADSVDNRHSLSKVLAEWSKRQIKESRRKCKLPFVYPDFSLDDPLMW
jgi:hypothetical protein